MRQMPHGWSLDLDRACVACGGVTVYLTSAILSLPDDEFVATVDDLLKISGKPDTISHSSPRKGILS